MNLNFTQTREWDLFLGIMRIALVVSIVCLAVYLYVEIEAVKLLLYNPCEICMSKTDITCWSMSGVFDG